MSSSTPLTGCLSSSSTAPPSPLIMPQRYPSSNPIPPSETSKDLPPLPNTKGGDLDEQDGQDKTISSPSQPDLSSQTSSILLGEGDGGDEPSEVDTKCPNRNSMIKNASARAGIGVRALKGRFEVMKVRSCDDLRRCIFGNQMAPYLC